MSASTTIPDLGSVRHCPAGYYMVMTERVLASERKEDAVAFLKAAVAWYAKLGIRVERVMTPSRDISFRNALPGSG